MNQVEQSVIEYVDEVWEDVVADIEQLVSYPSVAVAANAEPGAPFGRPVRGALDCFDSLGMLDGEIFGQLIEHGVGFSGERRHFGNVFVGGQALQPTHLNQYAKTDQTVFAENRAQSAGFAGVATIDGGNRGERGKLHGRRSRTIGR